MKFFKFTLSSGCTVRVLTFFCIVFFQINYQANGQTRICNIPLFSKGCNSASIASIAIVDATKDTVFSFTSKTVCDQPTEIPAISTIALKPNNEYTLYVKTATTGYSIGAFLSNDGDLFYNEIGVDNVINLVSSASNVVASKFTVSGQNGSTLRMRILSTIGKRSYVLNDACTGADFAQGEFEDYVFNIRNCNLPRGFSAGQNDTICIGGFDTLNGTFLNNATIKWSPSNLVLQPNNPSTNTAVLNATTTFTYSAINDTSRCRYTDAVTIYVNPTPSAKSYIAEVQKGNRCPYPGNELKIYLDPTVTTPVLYQWYNKAGLIKGATKSTYIATTSDTYYATIQYKKSCAVTKLNSITIDLIPAEIHTISTTSNVLCPKGSLNLKSSLPASGYRFQWAKINKPLTANIDDTVAINNETNSQIAIKDTGRYILLAYNISTGCISFNKEGNIKIVPSTISAAIAKQSLGYCPNSSVAIQAVYSPKNVTFQWMYGSSGLPIATNSSKEVYNASESKSIFVKVSDGSCTVNSDTVYPRQVELFKVGLSTASDCKGASTQIISNYDASLANYKFAYEWYSGKEGNPIDASETKTSNYPYAIAPSKVGVKYFLKVATEDGKCSETAAITVPTKPQPFKILADNDTICEGTGTFITNNLKSPYFEWTMPNKTSISNTASFYTNLEGWHFANGIIVDANQNECFVRDSIYITVLKKPTITPNLKYADTTVCAPKTVTLELIGDTKNIKSYEWTNYGEITVEGANKSIFEATQSGDYTALAIGLNGCKSDNSNSKIVTINDLPAAAKWYSYNQNERTTTQICSGDSLFTNISAMPKANDIVNISLLLNNAVVKPIDSGTNNLYYRIKLAGDYTARVTNTITGCIADTVVKVIAIASPQIKIHRDSTFCTNNTFVLNTNYGATYKYLWIADNGTIADTTLNETNLSLFSTFIPPQIKVSLRVTDQVTSCIATDTFLLTVIQNFTVNSQTGSPECSGGLGYAKAIPLGGKAPFQYLWNDADNQTKDSILVKSGIYSVAVKDSRGCSNSAQQVIVQNKGFSNIIIDTVKYLPPTCGNIPNGEIEIDTNSTLGKTTVKWTAGTINLGSSLKLSNLKGGTYTVTVSDILGCKSATFEFADPIAATSGTIAGDKSLNIGTPMPIISNVTSPKGNQNLKIQWQKSENKQTWDTIPGANQLDYSPIDLTATTSFRRLVTDACSTYYSNMVTYTMRPALPDSISGVGKVGAPIAIMINSTYKSPYTVVLSIAPTNNQGQSIDTTLSFSSNTFSFASKREGIYTIKSVNGTNVSATARGNATIGNSGALLSGEVTLGQPLKIVFIGNIKFKVKIYYNFFATPQSNPIKDSVIFDNELSKFIPTQTGRYELLSLIDGNGTKGQATGFANVNPVFNPPTADIKGGGYVGSIISITITPNSGVGPWDVEILLDDMPYKTITMEGLAFQFPSEKPGKYKIKSVNNNRRGNGEAIVITINPLPDLNSVFVWNAVSPDGDGKNDHFVIQIPLWLDSLGFKFDLDIFDREGTFLKKMHEVDAATLGTTASNDMLEYKWNGKNENGELLTPGTYFFSFKINDSASKNKPTKAEKEKANRSGFLEIRR